MSVLHIMVGIPGSGKSYYCKDKEHVVSRDKIRFSMLEEDDDYFAKEKEVFDEYISAINWRLLTYGEAYADATHLDRNSRLKLLNRIDPDLVHKVVFEVFDTPFAVCAQRNAARIGRA